MFVEMTLFGGDHQPTRRVRVNALFVIELREVEKCTAITLARAGALQTLNVVGSLAELTPRLEAAWRDHLAVMLGNLVNGEQLAHIEATVLERVKQATMGQVRDSVMAELQRVSGELEREELEARGQVSSERAEGEDRGGARKQRAGGAVAVKG
jgi:hypothetical protein